MALIEINAAASALSAEPPPHLGFLYVALLAAFGCWSLLVRSGLEPLQGVLRRGGRWCKILVSRLLNDQQLLPVRSLRSLFPESARDISPLQTRFLVWIS